MYKITLMFSFPFFLTFSITFAVEDQQEGIWRESLASTNQQRTLHADRARVRLPGLKINSTNNDYQLNPSNAKATFVQSTKMQRFLKTV